MIEKNYSITLVAPGPQKKQFGAISHLPLPVLSLASWVREYADFAVDLQIVDTQCHNVSKQQFEKSRIVGISAMTGYQVKSGLDIAEIVRSVNPDALIVWGGVHPSLLPEQTVLDRRVDLVVVGEGEQTFLEVVEAWREGRSLEGIKGTCVQRTDGKIILGEKRDFLDLDRVPIPAYDLIELSDYPGIEKQFDYQSSRGCPFRCGFCYNIAFCGSRYRKKTAKKVIQELCFLANKYKVENFGFVDDEFFIESKRTEAIMDGILASNSVFRISASCRLDVISRFPETLLKKMKKAGVSHIFFGAESGSPQVLADIQKDITREQIIFGSKRVADVGIRPFLSFMSGFPGESIKEFQETLDLIRELWDTHTLITVNGIFPFNAYPGTMLYEKALGLGFNAPSSLEEWGEWSFQYEPDSPWLDKKQKEWMKIVFYMVRFKYYLVRYEDRHKGKFHTILLKTLLCPLLLSINLRMKRKWFAFSWEWKLFAAIFRKTFGYL